MAACLDEQIGSHRSPGSPDGCCVRPEEAGGSRPAAVKAFGAVDEAIARYIDELLAAGMVRDPERRAAAALSSGLVMSAVEACRHGTVDHDIVVDELVEAFTRWWSPETSGEV